MIVSLCRARIQRLLNSLEALTFRRIDTQRQAQGLEVTSPARWMRQYRDPNLAATLAARTTAASDSGVTTSNPAPTTRTATGSTSSASVVGGWEWTRQVTA